MFVKTNFIGIVNDMNCSGFALVMPSMWIINRRPLGTLAVSPASLKRETLLTCQWFQSVVVCRSNERAKKELIKFGFDLISGKHSEVEIAGTRFSNPSDFKVVI